MAELLASTSELATRLSTTFDTGQENRAAALLEDASALVLDEGDPTWTSQSVPDRVKTVVLQVAQRVWVNPEGAAQTSIGSYSVSYGGRSASQGAVSLTKPERRAVRRAAGRSPLSVTLVTPWSG